MTTIGLEQIGVDLDLAPQGVRLSSPAGVLAVVNAPELVRRPNELHWWLRGKDGLVLTATHATRLFNVHLDTGTTEVAASLQRRYSDVLGDQVQFLACREAPDGALLVLYESGLVCLDTQGNLRWHQLHNDITATFRAVDGEHVCIETRPPIEGSGAITYFRLEDGRESRPAA